MWAAQNIEPVLREKVRALISPTTYRERTSKVEPIETHFAWVFLTDEHAYKLKKPVRIVDVDLTTLDMREIGCAEEVRLNQRLAADVYLGVVPLVRTQTGVLRVGTGGRVVDWLVKMRRLPGARMLDRAIASGTVSASSLHAVGELLACFYGGQPRIAIRPQQYLRRLGQQIDEDHGHLLDPELRLSAPFVEAIAGEQHCALAALGVALGERAAQEHIVEAHGDLRPEHVCLCSPPCIIDALEFSRDLRILDPLEELAFFSIECEAAGAAWVGQAVLDAYLAESGDTCAEALFDFYRSRRASMRAKVVAWHLLDPAVRDLAPWQAKAEVYLIGASRHARAASAGALTLERDSESPLQ